MNAAEELATLVADVLAAAESWRASGASAVPSAPRSAEPALGGARPHEPAPSPKAVAAAHPPPRITPVRPAVLPTQPPRVEPRATPPLPPQLHRVEPATGAAPAALFGARWASALRDRAAEISSWIEAQPPCGACGRPVGGVLGTGSSDARLAIVTADPDGASMNLEGAATLDKMLLHVLSLERADLWLIEANGCAVNVEGGCRAALRHQLEVLAPRMVLLMGAPVLGAFGRGEWSRWQQSDVLTTFHPHQLQARPADRRPTMEHLTLFRSRL